MATKYLFFKFKNKFFSFARYRFLCPELFSDRFSIENKLKILISENECFHQEIIADQSFVVFT
jgi:hypothetical protein